MPPAGNKERGHSHQNKSLRSAFRHGARAQLQRLKWSVAGFRCEAGCDPEKGLMVLSRATSLAMARSRRLMMISSPASTAASSSVSLLRISLILTVRTARLPYLRNLQHGQEL